MLNCIGVYNQPFQCAPAEGNYFERKHYWERGLSYSACLRVIPDPEKRQRIQLVYGQDLAKLKIKPIN